MKDVNQAITLLEKWPENIFRLWTGFKPTTFALPVQCPTNWATKPHESGLLPWTSYASAEYYIHWIYRVELTQDRSHVALIDSLGHFSFLRTTAKHKLVEGLFRSLLLAEVSQNNLIYYNHHRRKQLRKRNGSWSSDIQLILSVFRRTSYCCWGRIWANHWLSSSYRGSWWMSCSNKDSIRIPSVLSESFEKSFNNPTGKEQLSNCLRIEKSS